MSDLYSELLVKKEKSPKDNLIKAAAIGVTSLFVFVGLFIHTLGIVAAIVVGILSYMFILPKTDLEYEYLFVNGDMDIDMVMAKTKRKKVTSFKMSEAVIAAPVKSHRLDHYKNNQKVKILDYSSGNDSHNRMGIVVPEKDNINLIVIEPDENLAKAIKNSAPSKVFLD